MHHDLPNALSKDLSHALNSIRFAFFFGLVSAGALGIYAGVFPENSAQAAEKKIIVRSVEPTDDFKLVIYSRVIELENNASFPVTTVDREAFTLELGRSTKIQIKPESLTMFGSAVQPRTRRLVIALPFASNVQQSVLQGFQQTIAENLPLTRSEFFSLLSATSVGVREIAGATPEQADNVRAVQRKLLDAEPNGTVTGIHEAVCAAAGKFKDWSRYASKPGEQKALILLGNPSEASRERIRRLETCLAELAASEVAVYLLRADNIPSAGVSAEASFEKPEMMSGGFVQKVISRVDLFPALLNVLANLNEEYVATFNLFPLIGTWDGRNAIAQDGFSFFSLGITYHGQRVSSGVLSVPLPQVWQENIAQFNKARPPGEQLVLTIKGLNPTERAVAGVLAFVLFSAMIFVLRYLWISLRLILRTVRCNTCGLRVKRSFTNCPYRDDGLVGWLSVLSGPGIGMVLPVKQGRNLIGTSGVCGIHLPGAANVRRKHAEMTVENGKVQFKVLTSAVTRRVYDRVNGFTISEARLICHGDVLKIGNLHLRFEVRPEVPDSSDSSNSGASNVGS